MTAWMIRRAAWGWLGLGLLGLVAAATRGHAQQYPPGYAPLAQTAPESLAPAVSPARGGAPYSPSSQMVTVSAATLDGIIRRLETLEAQQKKADAPEWLDMSGQKFSVKMGGRIMGDYIMFPSRNSPLGFENYVELRRLRLFMQGDGYGVFFYKFDLGFEPEANEDEPDSAVAVKDIFIGARDVPWLGKVELGYVKMPFSLEVLTSSKYISFLERGLPINYLPVRKLGFRATDHTPDQALFWQWAVFFDDFDPIDHQRISDAQGVSLVGRVVTTPYYCQDGRYFVHLGLMGNWTSDRDKQVRFQTRPETHEGPRFVDSGTFLADHYYDMGAQAAVNWGPWSVQSELFYRRTTGPAGDYDFYGAYVFASYFITGEHRAYKRSAAHFDRLKPYTNFWIVRGQEGVDWGWGAWQVVARWSYYDVSNAPLQGTLPVPDNPYVGMENNVAVGVNWYWNPYMRVMLDVTHAWAKYNYSPDGELSILGMRFQVDW